MPKRMTKLDPDQGTLPDESLVMASTNWKTNSDMIVDCRRLGYLDDDNWIYDPTYAGGGWWKKWHPTYLYSNSRNVGSDADEVDPTFDFRRTCWEDDSWPRIAYDPPYVAMGGRKSTQIAYTSEERYGMAEAPYYARDLQCLINDGLTEMHRILEPRGFILVKCQDYIQSSKFWDGVWRTGSHARSLGLTQVDHLHMVGNVRPQPPYKNGQQHARNNQSDLLVFQKPRKARRG